MEIDNYFLNLSDEKLKEELAKITVELMENTKTYSIKGATLGINLLAYAIDEDNFENEELNGVIKGIAKRIEAILYGEGSSDLKKEAGMKLRNEIVCNLELLSSYSHYAQDLIDLYEYKNFKEVAENFNVPVESRDVLLENLKNKLILTFIKLDNRPEDKLNLIKIIVSKLPMVYTKDKIFEIIWDSLNFTLAGSSEYQAEIAFAIIRKLALYKRASGYGENFKDLFERLNYYENKSDEPENFNELGENKIDDESLVSIIKKFGKNMEEIANIRNEINNYSTIMSDIGYCANYMMTYLSIDREDEPEIAEFKKKYIALDEENKKKFIEKLEKNIKEDSKLQNNKLSSFMQINYATILRKKLDLKDVLPDLNKMQNAARYYNDTRIVNEDILDADHVVPITEKALKSKVEALISDIDDGLNDFEGERRRIVLRRLLASLYSPFRNPVDFFEYTKDSLTSSSLSLKYSIVRIMALSQELDMVK